MQDVRINPKTITVTEGKGQTMLNAIRQFVKEEEGASAAEYALILAIITIGIVVAMQQLSGAITGAINNATQEINSASGS
jgi:pilus assembly protein Flp/PilA